MGMISMQPRLWAVWCGWNCLRTRPASFHVGKTVAITVITLLSQGFRCVGFSNLSLNSSKPSAYGTKGRAGSLGA